MSKAKINNKGWFKKAVIATGSIAALYFLILAINAFSPPVHNKIIQHRFNKIKLPSYLSLKDKSCFAPSVFDLNGVGGGCKFVYISAANESRAVIFSDLINALRGQGFSKIANNVSKSSTVGVETVNKNGGAHRDSSGNMVYPQIDLIEVHTYRSFSAKSKSLVLGVELKAPEGTSLLNYESSPVAEVDIDAN